MSGNAIAGIWFGSVFTVIIFSCIWFAFREGHKSRRLCVTEACQARRSANCADGRCSYHCLAMCKCRPPADGRPLRSMKGGRA